MLTECALVTQSGVVVDVECGIRSTTQYISSATHRCDTNTRIIAELRCLSTDTKPTKVGDKIIDNGSQLIEIDTGKIYLYDLASKTWKEI